MSAPLLRIPGPSATDLPPGVTVEAILADLSDDQVSAPPEQVDDLVAEVARAQEHGIDLSVVVIDRDPRMDSQLRDLATEVGAEDGGTVLVLSPGWVGTFSDSLDRVTLEAAEDHTYTGNPVVSTKNFVDSVIEPSPPWTMLTILLVLVVAAASGATYWAKSRRAARSVPVEHAQAPAEGTTPTT
ncbi:DUF6676 family protein [Rhodococcus sp. NPDC058639]|uniref:Rv1476 family membrane protein n=1 Tax=Rhodococcus sp. NPDC058639 TaxID=3346570 RepID=UPI00364B7E1E